MKVFLSGSKTAVTLPEQLKQTIDRYCDENAEFLIGDCFGADILKMRNIIRKHELKEEELIAEGGYDPAYRPTDI